jgi:hypothetical protein
MPCLRACSLAVLVLVAACQDDPMAPGDDVADGGAAGAAGAGDGDGDGDGDGGDGCDPVAMELTGDTPLPPEIVDVLERRCWKCHSDPVQNYAPMPLVSWQDVQAPRHETNPDPVYVVIGARIHSERFPMPPEREPQLTDDELATLDAWIAECAPAAD